MRQALILIALAITAAACSRSDADHLRHDVSKVGADAGADIRHVGDDPNLRRAGAELKAAARKTDNALRHTADDAHRHADGQDRDQGN
jgi:hypothetical protein